MELVGGRFELRGEAGAGGMARVYRAHDLHSRETVAVKILHPGSETDYRRFEREASVLATLRSPGVVRYVAHGRAPDGQPFLAMEWLEGVDLEEWLDERTCTADETVALGCALAAALAAVHAAGVVHRDVKPSNVYLLGGDVARPKIVDFGIARDNSATHGLTRTGSVIGTPLYMSPEQARGEPNVDARADVFALAGLLYRSLTGRPPFMATSAIALLAKIVLDDPTPLRELVPDAPKVLEAILGSMFDKSKDNRPTAAEVERAFASLENAQFTEPAPRRPSLRKERRVVCIVLAGGAVADAQGFESTLSGDSVHRLADGSHLMVFSGPESPSDLASRAVEAAITVSNPGASVAVATGLALVSGSGIPMGDSIDRAAAALGKSEGRVWLDSQTAGLVEGRYALEPDDHGMYVAANPGDGGDVRTLLGRPTPFVGRTRELAVIEAYYRECIEERITRAVVAVGPAGVGKSRLTHEVLTRVEASDEPPTRLFGRGEPLSTRAPFSLVATVIRRAAGAVGTTADLGPRVQAHLASRGVSALGAEFLVAALGAPVGPHGSDVMKAAQDNPAGMFDHIRAAWLEWLDLECRRRPVLLVVEDLHWSDPSSLLLLEAALVEHDERPLMLFANARPEIRTMGRGLWEAGCHEIPLDSLRRKASEELVRHALGPDADDEDVARIVELSEGNAFLLEELVRAAASGEVESVPEGAIGVVQLRFDEVSPEARVVMRAASVLGERFDLAGVRAVMGHQSDAALAELVTAELVVRAPAEEGADAYLFRHALVRDAAYMLIPDEDRRLAHAAAGAHLEARGSDAAILADHFERGGVLDRAARWYRTAAEHALLANDLDGAREHAKRALDYERDDEVRGAIELVVAEVESWAAGPKAACLAAERAVALLRPGSGEWLNAVGLIVTAVGQQGENDQVERWLERVLEITPDPEAGAELVSCLSRAYSQIIWDERDAIAKRTFAKIEEVARSETLSAHVQARVHFARAYDHLSRAEMDQCIEELRKRAALHEATGAETERIQAVLLDCLFTGFCGRLEEGLEGLSRCLEEAERLRSDYLVGWVRFEQAGLQAIAGNVDESERILAQVPIELKTAPLFASASVTWLGYYAIRAGDLDALERQLERIRGKRLSPRYQAVHGAFEAWAALERGDEEAASQHVEQAIALITRSDTVFGDLHSTSWAVVAEVLLRLDPKRAVEFARDRVAQLRRIAAGLADPQTQRSFITRIAWHARLVEIGASREA